MIIHVNNIEYHGDYEGVEEMIRIIDRMDTSSTGFCEVILNEEDYHNVVPHFKKLESLLYYCEKVGYIIFYKGKRSSIAEYIDNYYKYT